MLGRKHWTNKVLMHLLPLGDPLGILQVQFHHFLGGQPHSQRALRTVNPGVDHGIKLEFQPQVFFGKPLHVPNLVLVDRDPDRLERQRKPPLHEQPDPIHAAFIRPRNAGQPLVRFLCPAVEGDLDSEGTVVGKKVGDLGSDQRAVGEQRDEEPLLLGIGVDAQKIFPREDFSSAVQQP